MADAYVAMVSLMKLFSFMFYSGNTQMTVNNQIVVGTLMNLSDNPTRVSIGQDWRESDITNRVPVIVTGNDFSTLYAPLVRDGRMDKFYWCVSLFYCLELPLSLFAFSYNIRITFKFFYWCITFLLFRIIM